MGNMTSIFKENRSLKPEPLKISYRESGLWEVRYFTKKVINDSYKKYNEYTKEKPPTDLYNSIF